MTSVSSNSTVDVLPGRLRKSYLTLQTIFQGHRDQGGNNCKGRFDILSALKGEDSHGTVPLSWMFTEGGNLGEFRESAD